MTYDWIISIGHSRLGDDGAVSTGGVNEWTFNGPVAEKAKHILTAAGVSCLILDELDSTSYTAWVNHVANECKRVKAKGGCELHFNASSDPNSNGHEYLYYHASSNGQRLARAFAGRHQASFPTSNPRRDNGIYPKTGGNGFQLLQKTPCPFIITEPFFGSNPTEWGHYSQNVDRLAQVNAGGILDFLGVAGGQPQPEPPSIPTPPPGVTTPCPWCQKPIKLEKGI